MPHGPHWTQWGGQSATRPPATFYFPIYAKHIIFFPSWLMPCFMFSYFRLLWWRAVKSTACNFWCLHFLRRFKYVLVLLKVGAENTKTFTKEKHFLKNHRQFFQLLFFEMYTNLKEGTWKIFRLVFVQYKLM